AQRVAVELQAVAGLAEVAGVADEPELGVDGAGGRRGEPVDRNGDRRVRGDGGEAVEDGQAARRVGRGSVCPDQGPAAIPLGGGRGVGRDVGGGVDAIARGPDLGGDVDIGAVFFVLDARRAGEVGGGGDQRCERAA